MSAGVPAAWGARCDRWLRHVCDWAARIATLAAGLCPMLSSLGGAVVGALLLVGTVCRSAGDRDALQHVGE
jgi:hypothetical protein